MPKKSRVKALVIDPYRQEVYETSILRMDKKGGSEIFKHLKQFYCVAFTYEFDNDEQDLLLVGEERQETENDEKMFSINSKVSEERWTFLDNPLRGVGILIGNKFGENDWSDVKTTAEDLAASITLH